MNRYMLFLISLLLLPATNITAQRKEITYLPEDSLTVCRLLDEARRLPRTTNYMLFFGKKFLYMPYIAHTLEVNDNEQLVVNTRQFDCTTFIEIVTSLSLCAYQKLYSWSAFVDALSNMRYRGGSVGDYTSRIHYFTEWIDDNAKAGIVTEIKNSSPLFTAIQEVHVSYMSSHPEHYKALCLHPEYMDEIRQMEDRISGRRYRYIPKNSLSNLSELRKVIEDGDIIAICCNKKGLDIAHLGLAVWKKGNLHLLNASQLHKKIVVEPMTLYKYLQKHPSHTGIRIVRINK